jgi:outer membrane autotransporter protein
VSFAGFADTLESGYDATSAEAFGEIGYRLPFRSGWVEPFALVSVNRVKTDGFAETGGSAALAGAATTHTATIGTFGFKGATGDAGPLNAGWTLGWQTVVDGVTPVSSLAFTGGSPFRVRGAALAPAALAGEVSMDWRLAPGATLSARYSGLAGDGVVDHAVQASLTLAF